MSSFSQSLNQNRQFIITVKVIESTLERERYKDGTAPKLLVEALPQYALIDTGANTTSISQKYAEELDLTSISKTITNTAGGDCKTDLFLVDIAIPVAKTVLKPFTTKDGTQQIKQVVIGEENWAHAELSVNSFFVTEKYRGFNILLGMDILYKMHITMFGGQIIMSF